MLDLVGNTEDRFACVTAQVVKDRLRNKNKFCVGSALFDFHDTDIVMVLWYWYWLTHHTK